MTHIEVCTGSIDDSITAWRAGASRIELNSSLETGGLTPSSGVISGVIGSVPIPVLVMIRPRSGGFVYSSADRRAMLFDAENCLSHGAAGVVFGSLTPEMEIDGEFTGEILRIAGGADTVFHMAFDLIPDKTSAASFLADLGVKRILTAGGKATAWEGRDVIRGLAGSCRGRPDILPGSGINPGNAAALVKHTGCRWIHGSFRGADGSLSVSLLRMVVEALSDIGED